MRLAALLLALSPAVVVLGATSDGGDRPESDDRIVLFHGGTFHSGFDGRETTGFDRVVADAVLVKNGRIVAVGSEPALSASDDGRRAERVDIGGAHAFPGFQDAHGSIEQYGAKIEGVDLQGCATYAEVVGRVRERAAELPAGEWITGRGWDQSLWPEAAFPEHGPLSVAVPDHPVFVERVDGHAALVNEAALVIAGLAGSEAPKETPADPKGGRVVRDPDGAPTGVLIDTAMGLVRQQIPAPTDATRIRRILRAQDALLAVGLTCVHDMGVDRRSTELFAKLRDDGRLVLRVVAYLGVDASLDATSFDGLPVAGDPRDVYRVAGIEVTLDGALGSRGAALLEPYSDAPEESGLTRYTGPELARIVALAARRGLQPAVHAIGDRANRIVLDAYEDVGRQVEGFVGLRPRVEYAQVVDVGDFERFGKLGLVAAMLPVHATSDMRWVPARIGDERAARAYAWRTMSKSTPLPLAFGSAFPGERPDPLEGIYAAITRQDQGGAPEAGFHPAQRLRADEALAGFTSGAAFAATQDDRRGRIALGYGCDMTIVDVDLSTLTPTDARRALDAKILMTVVNGDVVYRAE